MVSITSNIQGVPEDVLDSLREAALGILDALGLSLHVDLQVTGAVRGDALADHTAVVGPGNGDDDEWDVDTAQVRLYMPALAHHARQHGKPLLAVARWALAHELRHAWQEVADDPAAQELRRAKAASLFHPLPYEERPWERDASAWAEAYI